MLKRFVFLILLILFFGCVTQQNTTSNSTQIKLQVDFFCYSFEADPLLDCTINESQIKDTLSEVNLIWEQANIEWVFGSFNLEQISSNDFALKGNETPIQIKESLLEISPVTTNGDSTWKVVIIRNFPSPVNSAGLYLPASHTIYFAETKKNNSAFIEVKPYVLAHELGHSLSLAHTEKDLVDNLMGPGAVSATLPTLTVEQIEKVKTQALKGPADPNEMPVYND